MPFENQLAQLKEKFAGVSPLVRNIALGVGGVAAIVASLLLGPLHGVFGRVQVTGTIEYGTTRIDLRDVLKSPDDSVDIKISGAIDTTKVGEQTVPVTLSKWVITNPTEAVVTIKDTQPPTVKFVKDKITVEMGDNVIPSSNIVEVSDPVDGELSPVMTEPEARGTKAGLEVFYDEGWYMAESPFVADKAGETDIRVTATDRHGNQTVATFVLDVLDPLKGVKLNKTQKILEYANEKIDALSVVKCSDRHTEVTAKKIDLSKIGKQVVTYNLKKHNSTRSVDRTFFVYDTQLPVIEIGDTTVKVGQFETFDPRDNIRKVEDPVDGELSEVTEAPQAKGTVIGHELFYDDGWYRVDGTVDTNTIGNYPITVTAYDKHGNSATINYTVTVVDPLDGVTITASNTNIEYGQGTIDPVALVTCSDPEVRLSAPALPVNKLGNQTVTYTLVKGQSMRQATMNFTIRDSQAPHIALASTSVNVKLGSAYDPFSNVRSVTDPVDGSLPRVNNAPSAPGNGWYTISGSFDTNRAGKYTVQVVACDRNGNQSTSNYTITVK